MGRDLSLVIALTFVAVLALDVEAQTRGARGTAASARAAAPFDLTGQWVAIISKDWRWRMITPPKGDIVGGRSAAYEEELRKAKAIAIQEMQQQAADLGANAVIGVDLDYESIQMGGGGGMLMVSASGTAVTLAAGE